MISNSLSSLFGSRLKLNSTATSLYLTSRQAFNNYGVNSYSFGSINCNANKNLNSNNNNKCLCQRCININSSNNIYNRCFSTKNNNNNKNNNNSNVDKNKKVYDFESLENDPYDDVESDIKVDPEVVDRIRVNRSSLIRPMPLDPKERDASNIEELRAQNRLNFPHEYREQFDRELFPKVRDPTREQLDEYDVRGAIPLAEHDEILNHPRLDDDWAAEEIDDDEDIEDEVQLDDEDNYAQFDSDRFEPFLPARPMARVENTYNGVAHGYSKRKDAKAVALIQLGTGELTINGRTLADYFGNCIAYKDTVLRPLVITETLVKWDIEIRVIGGGIKGQADAICRALALAISNYDLGYRMALRFSGLLKSDIRRVERKKPGQLKARKKFPLVKR
ncbi:30S ribosomal protein S9 [Heterostelium album PN500]|uniref:30S ribosomal protein S9 n=1 Tax=Heterostelium pallidum (strain ATCC 26659 / Pp 5 / PN500) TaxID=670386 RepID=D3BTX3_HETP5|nr:30S ribosomal protein S9 [Heterostelium album PN500]EFA75159.1 30S ribosomal protein S9 [Heterostelium album PN500]|eukprot:XP_020427293.1 30S ribosomal protein S9 [Heterostelium album PN500]